MMDLQQMGVSADNYVHWSRARRVFSMYVCIRTGYVAEQLKPEFAKAVNGKLAEYVTTHNDREVSEAEITDFTHGISDDIVRTQVDLHLKAARRDSLRR